MTMRILVTGSRSWIDRGLIRRALAEVLSDYHEHEQFVLMHGGCTTGADHIADQIWRDWMRRNTTLSDPEVHEADWDHCGSDCQPGHRKPRARGGDYCPTAGPRRNAEMVAAGADICLAFPLGRSPGTRDCIARAEKAGIPVRVFG